MRSLVIPFFLLLRFSACCLALSFEWFAWRFLTLPSFPMLSFAFPRFLLFFCAREASGASPVCLVNEASPISWTLGLLVSWSLGLLVSLSLGFAAFWSLQQLLLLFSCCCISAAAAPHQTCYPSPSLAFLCFPLLFHAFPRYPFLSLASLLCVLSGTFF